jgi:hypothetical protein
MAPTAAARRNPAPAAVQLRVFMFSYYVRGAAGFREKKKARPWIRARANPAIGSALLFLRLRLFH